MKRRHNPEPRRFRGWYERCSLNRNFLESPRGRFHQAYVKLKTAVKLTSKRARMSIYVSVSRALDTIGPRFRRARLVFLSLGHCLLSRGGEADGEIAAFAGSLFGIGSHTTVHGSIGRAISRAARACYNFVCPVTCRGSRVLGGPRRPEFQLKAQ